MNDLLNDIISIFVDRKVLELKNVDISQALNDKGVSCSTSEVLSQIQTISPILFKLDRVGQWTVIQVDPQIEICDNFLSGNCHRQLKGCDNLHICRHFSRCTRSGCGFPHDLKHNYNEQLIRQRNLQSINDKLLIELIRLKKPHIFPPRGRRNDVRVQRGTQPTTASMLPDLMTMKNLAAPVLSENEIDRQIDVVYPSSGVGEPIDTELIELLLTSRGVQNARRIKEYQTRHFRRATLQLQSVANVEKVLATPIIQHDGVDIKFKRRKPTADQTCFLLKTPIDRVEDKIIGGRLTLYINALIQGGVKSTWTDVSINTEQIALVQCDGQLDFNQVHQQHKLRSTLQNRPMTLGHIYQYDTVLIRNVDEKRVMHYDDLQHIFADSWGNIFSFKFPNGPTAEVEFLTSAGLKEWLKNIESIKDKFKITVVPVIIEVDETKDSLQSPKPTVSTVSPSEPINDTESNRMILQLRNDWELIASHPLFQDEMKAYFRDQLGGDIEMRGAELIYTHPISSMGNRGSITKSLVANRTNNFMQKFRIETLRNLNNNHLQILRKHSRTAIWKRQNNRDYLVGTRNDDMRSLKSQLFPKKNSPAGTPQGSQYQSEHSSQRSSSPQGRPIDLLSNLSRSPSQTSLASRPALPKTSYQLKSSDQMSMFEIDGFENRLTQYFEDKYQVTIRVEKNRTIKEKRIIIQIEGTDNEVHKAENELTRLFSSLKTQIFDENNHGQWTKIDEAIDVIRHHLNGEGWLYTCQRVNHKSIKITHFDGSNQDFGVDERKITSLINDRFKGATTNLPSQSVSQDLMKAWNELQEEIQKKINYRKDICLARGQSSVYLFGLTRLVKDFHEEFEKLKKRFIVETVKIELGELERKYLNNVVKQEFAKLIQDWQRQGCDFDPARFRQRGEIVAPPQMHQKIKDDLKALTDCSTVEFLIYGAAFHSLVTSKFDEVLKIAKSKCFVQKETRTERISIPIPRAKFSGHTEPMKVSATASKPVSSSTGRVHIGQSSIEVLIGDLAQQKVDVIVLNLTSEYLCNSIIDIAGPSVKNEYAAYKANGSPAFLISNGVLPCKQILFLTAVISQSDSGELQSSLSKFVQSAINIVTQRKLRSLAFPSVGCGKLGFNLALVAKSMIGEAYLQLTKNNFNLDVSFVLLSQPKNVYEAFRTYLGSLETSVINAPTVTPMTTQRITDITSLPYDEKIVKITLISSNSLYVGKCKSDIEELAEQNSFERTLSDKKDLLDWSQETTIDFYKYCLKMDVIPTVDFDQLTVHLKGDKDGVNEAEKRFFELTTNTFREARLRAVARGIIWSVEKAHGSDDWEQYSFKNIGEIEDAYLKKRPQIDVTNEQNELCHIIFDKMEEQYRDRRRRIRRSETASSLPDYWEESSQSCKRVVLSSDSLEYKKVLQKFDETMQGKYQKICIERIQNERWYKQYAAHHEEYKKRQSQLDERLLFHGCTNDAAEKIIQECFNRSFAGINGVLFGKGVYFHTHASYSHNYAKVGPNGDRTIFLARVLIGKTTVGNQNLVTPPSGYDTTTDGQNIFVTYHDAAAYAEHLITYQ